MCLVSGLRWLKLLWLNKPLLTHILEINTERLAPPLVWPLTEEGMDLRAVHHSCFSFSYHVPFSHRPGQWLALKYSRGVRSLFLYILHLHLCLFIRLFAHARLPLALHLLTLVCRQRGVKKYRRLHNKQPCDHHAFSWSATDLHHPFSGVTAKLRWCVYIRISAIKNHITLVTKEIVEREEWSHRHSMMTWYIFGLITLILCGFCKNRTKSYCVCCPRLTPVSEVAGGKCLIRKPIKVWNAKQLVVNGSP